MIPHILLNKTNNIQTLYIQDSTYAVSQYKP